MRFPMRSLLRRHTCAAALLCVTFAACGPVPPSPSVRAGTPDARPAASSPVLVPPAPPVAEAPSVTAPLPEPPGIVVPPSERVAPDFALPAMTGGTFRLSEQRGKVVVLNFWATWCAPCLREMPDFAALQRELGARGVVFVGVSIDEGGWDVVRPFAARVGVNYPLVLDDGRMAERFGGTGILPTTYVIDRAGRVRIYADGAVTREDLRPILLALLAE